MNKTLCMSAAVAFVAAGLLVPVGVGAQEATQTNTQMRADNAPSGGATAATPSGDAAASGQTGMTGTASASGSAAMTGDAAGPTVSESDATAIRQTLSSATRAALAKDDFKSLDRQLERNDARRLRAAKVNNDDLNAAIDQLNSDWKAKYGSDLNLGDAKSEVVFGGDQYRIYQGDLAGVSRTAGERISPTAGGSVQTNGSASDTPRDPNMSAESARPPQFNENTTHGHSPIGTPGHVPEAHDAPAGGSAGPSGTAGGTAGGASAADQSAMAHTDSGAANPSADTTGNPAAGGANAATVVAVPTSGTSATAAPVNVRLVREGRDRWRINLPNSVDAQQLHDSLLTQVRALDADKANWPSDQNEAYRAVSAHVLSALGGSGGMSSSSSSGTSGSSSAMPAGYKVNSDANSSMNSNTAGGSNVVSPNGTNANNEVK